MTDTGAKIDGLRARKREATRSTIEKYAIALALEHGYDHVTVDMICEAAMVSQRTFFNYFGSKERVILGPTPSMTTDAEVARFVRARGPDVVFDLVASISAALIDDPADQELMRSRFLLITNTPELMARQMEWVTAQEERLVALVLERFRAEGRSEQATPDLADEARMVVALALSVLRFALLKLFGEPTTESPEAILRHSADLVARITRGPRP
ncbi:TetR/AcrR family transcriptional regulator [Cryobacterium tagatosivorans]|nr:TetR/AcrR family transcriptional regulator [Cryobacterium tagatosivorans]